jgi:hypothetical protein
LINQKDLTIPEEKIANGFSIYGNLPVRFKEGGIKLFIPKKEMPVFFIVLGIVLLLSGCGGIVMTEDFSQSYRVRSGTPVAVYNPNGDVTINGWDEDVIEINARKESIHGQEALDEVDIYIDIAGEMVIRTEYPPGARKVTVDYDIKVPEDLLVKYIECSNGNIIVDGLMGNPVLFSSNGIIQASNINGIVKARTSNGDINIKAVKGLEDLITSNGNIEAELPDLHDDIEIKTSNGSIKLALSPDLAVDLKAETSNGSITIQNINIDTEELNKTSLAGSMNGGGLQVSITTSNGSVELSRLK